MIRTPLQHRLNEQPLEYLDTLSQNLYVFYVNIAAEWSNIDPKDVQLCRFVI